MAARLLSFLLGALLTGIGWAIAEPSGLVGSKLPALALGVFEGHRPFIGWGAVALGVVSLLSAVLPRDEGPKKKRAAPLVDFDAVPDEPDQGDDGGHHHGGSGSPRPTALW